MFLEDFWFCIFMRYIDEDDKLIRYSYLQEIVMKNADKVNRVLAKKTDTVKPC